MIGLLRLRLVLRTFVLMGVLAAIDSSYSQQLNDPLPVSDQPPPVPASFREQVIRNATAPCLEPAPLPGLMDYDGPMKKTVGLFARALERTSIHEPHYRTGVPLCSLGVKEKFLLFVDDSIDPVTFTSAGIDAATDHASDNDPSFGQGVAGYATRFSADLADRISSKFFKDFAYPTVFDEDPRYYRLGQGSTGRRLLHAAEHLVVAHRSDGARLFNYSEWLGTGSSVALHNLYHPGDDRGARAMARQMGYRLAWDAGYDVLREFWPEIARKLKLPFRGVKQSAGPGLRSDPIN